MPPNWPMVHGCGVIGPYCLVHFGIVFHPVSHYLVYVSGDDFNMRRDFLFGQKTRNEGPCLGLLTRSILVIAFRNDLSCLSLEWYAENCPGKAERGSAREVNFGALI